VIVDELPHGVSSAGVLAEIEALTNPQPRAGKKEVSQEQKNLRQLVLGVLDTVRDESSDKAPVRIVLEPKSSRQARRAARRATNSWRCCSRIPASKPTPRST